MFWLRNDNYNFPLRTLILWLAVRVSFNRFFFIGTVTVVSLLTGSVIARFYGDATGPTTVASSNSSGNVTVYPVYQDDGNDEDDLPKLPDDIKIKIIITLTFLVGIVQVSFSGRMCNKQIIEKTPNYECVR